MTVWPSRMSAERIIEMMKVGVAEAFVLAAFRLTKLKYSMGGMARCRLLTISSRSKGRLAYQNQKSSPNRASAMIRKRSAPPMLLR
jgi:hypothetical protein